MPNGFIWAESDDFPVENPNWDSKIPTSKLIWTTLKVNSTLRLQLTMGAINTGDAKWVDQVQLLRGQLKQLVD